MSGNNGTSIVGICRSMCPEKEVCEREKSLLIHFFEQLDNQALNDRDYNKATSGDGDSRGILNNQQQRQRRIRQIIKADRSKAVKAYTRPAAGVTKTIPSDLRPPLVLKKTVAYLCTKILVRTDRPFIDVYDFVFDRLRAVRQDMVIQRICDESAILILEAIIKFHLYAEYKYNAPRSYDPCINQKHLKDCLKTLLSLYGCNSYWGSTRAFYEALYCLTAPESYEVISRAFAIRKDMTHDPVFADALEVSLAIQNKNFYKFFQLLDELPPLLSAFAVQQVLFMRTHALKAISLSYGGQSCKIPLEWIQEILCYPNLNRTEKDMRRIGGQVIDNIEINDKFVKFVKNSPFMMNDNNGVVVDTEVKFTVLNGLGNVDVLATEQICPWGRELLY